MPAKTKILTMFGGRSPEHDVSIITGVQAMSALDPERYEAFPLYVAPDGTWLVGDALKQLGTYIPGREAMQALTKVTLDVTSHQTPALITQPQGFWQKSQRILFDVALLAFHGLVGEDGGIQGMLEAANIPYTGMRLKASAIMMDKAATKKILASTNVPMLKFWEIKRPAQGLLLTPNELAAAFKDVVFPCCIKPAHLGSSIGVARVTNWQDVSDVLAQSIFRYDDTAMLEPFVENLVEYNVAVRRDGDKITTSAIERPKRSSEFLDFKAKYGEGGSKKMGSKMPTANNASGLFTDAMLAQTRDINVDIPTELASNIRAWAAEVYKCVDGTGAPRLDFLSNEKTGEIWFNEANPIPGALGYFLWQAAKQQPLLFSELLDHLIKEAQLLHTRGQIPLDPTPVEARLFQRR